jgi:hypothetical protein
MVGVTPNGDLIVVAQELIIGPGKTDGKWIGYICARADYERLEQYLEGENVRIRKEIEQL